MGALPHPEQPNTARDTASRPSPARTIDGQAVSRPSAQKLTAELGQTTTRRCLVYPTWQETATSALGRALQRRDFDVVLAHSAPQALQLASAQAPRHAIIDLRKS